MISRKECFKRIAERYQFGYAEINNSKTIFLTSTYDPNKEFHKSYPLSPPFLHYMVDLEKFLNFTEGYSLSGFVHLYTKDVPGSISKESMDKFLSIMDAEYLHKTTKNQKIPTPSLKTSIFESCQIGINKPIKSLRVFGSNRDFQSENQYSIILNFSKKEQMQTFLGGISENDKVAAKKEIFMTFECAYQAGCYQILVPRHKAYEALLLLLGKHQNSAHLPITDFLLNQLKPRSFLSFGYHSLNDFQYKTIFEIIQMFVNKQEKTLISDFDTETQKIITSHKAILKAFNDTIQYFNQTESLLESRFPKVLGHLIREY